MDILNKVTLIVGLGVLALAGAVALNPSLQSPQTKTETVYGDPGGDIFTFMSHYQQMKDSHEKLRVDGVCASACTYFLNILPQDSVCATDQAWFGFHGVYSGFGGFNEPFTQWSQAIAYPQFVRDLLKNEYGFDGTADVDTAKYPTGVIWITGDKIQTELHIKKCD